MLGWKLKKPVASLLCAQVGLEEVRRGVTIPNPKESHTSPKVPEEDTGDHMLVVRCSSTTSTLQLRCPLPSKLWEQLDAQAPKAGTPGLARGV